MKISNLAKWLVGVPYFWFAIGSSLSILYQLVWFVHTISWKILLLLVVTGIIGVFLVPIAILFSGFSTAIEVAQAEISRKKGYALFIGISIAGLVIPQIWMFLLAVVLSLLGHGQGIYY